MTETANRSIYDRIKLPVSILLLIAMAFEVLRSAFRDGDFIGYIRAGKLTLEGGFIYSDYLNTWPPFFSIFCVPFGWLDNINGVLLRGAWTLSMVLLLFACMRIFLRWILDKEIALPWMKPKANQISFTHPLVLIPLLIMFRYVLDNQTNLQINIFLLWLCLLSIDWLNKDKIIGAALLLALAISIKAYPIFILFFFAFKFKFRFIAYTVGSLLLINATPFLVYGFDTGLSYYSHWWNEIASPFPASNHKNQSFFLMLRNYLHADNPKLLINPSIANIPLEHLKGIGYAIVAVVAGYPMYLFGNKLSSYLSKRSLLEYAFVFAAICILSPVAWKSNFIFLYPAYVLIYYYLFFEKNTLSKDKRKTLLPLFWTSLVCHILSSELFTGNHFSDVLESLSIITIGTILVLVQLIIIYRNMDWDSPK